MVVVDTTVWVDYLRGARNAESDWLHQELPVRRVGVPDLVLCEVLQGIRDDASFGRVLELLSDCELMETGGAELAVEAAQNFRRLRGRGHTVRKTIDCLIATFCLRDGYELLHRDRDYDPFERELGLAVLHP